jgi:bifunctional non-homologous end joining protein LigD
MLQRTFPAGFIAPCLPTKTDKLPSGSQWLHEIKHDGFRIIARKTGAQVRLYSRPGNDLTDRFPLIVEALARLRSRSCIIDGEAVCCDDNGVPSFDRIRYRQHDGDVFLYAFDLIELNGDDLRRISLYSSSNSKRRNEDRHSARRLPTPSHHLAAGCASDRGQPAPATV